MYVLRKVIRSPRLENEQHMIISEFNMTLLAKCEMYTIGGFTKSNIDTLIKVRSVPEQWSIWPKHDKSIF